MKPILKKLGAVLKTIFGYGILICLFAGGLSFFGYVAALIIGGDIAAEICTFLHKTYLPIVIYASSVMVLLGLVSMYLSAEKALTIEKEKKKK